jgi:SAM-dependent methyltransferase
MANPVRNPVTRRTLLSAPGRTFSRNRFQLPTREYGPKMFRDFVQKLPRMQRLSSLLMFAEEQWFDTTRRVRTAGPVTLDRLTVRGDRAGGHKYLPVRPIRARQILRNLPIRDYSAYTFVDIGSGKGRMLLLAAEYPFRKIQGLEFAAELHDQAEENIRRYRNRKRKCGTIESLRMDALNYTFPNENLVLYLFNPFGRDTLERFLTRLDTSIEQHPRDVILVLSYFEFDSPVSAMRSFRIEGRIHRSDIFRSAVSKPQS